MSEVQRKPTLIDTAKTPADLLREIQKLSDVQNYKNSSTFLQDASDAEAKVAGIVGQLNRARMLLPKDKRAELTSAMNDHIGAFFNALDETVRRITEESKQQAMAKLPGSRHPAQRLH